MKLRFTNDWLRRQIEKDADVDCEAGIPLREAASIERFMSDDTSHPTHSDQPHAEILQLLIRQVRRRDQLSIAQLAERLQVAPEDVSKLENEAGFIPSPRTMHRIALYINVPTPAVQRLATPMQAQNDTMKDAALKFAASSDDLSVLSQAERRSLNDFVKVLSAYKEK